MFQAIFSKKIYQARPCMAFYGCVWPSVAVYGRVWPFMAVYGLVWSFYGLKWHFVVFIGRILSFLAVIDPNSFGLVIIKQLIFTYF